VEDPDSATGQEIGFGLRPLQTGPTPRRYAMGCYELRLSGVAPCCTHLYTDDDPRGARVALRHWVPPDGWDPDAPLPSMLSIADEDFGRGCEAVDEASCTTLASCRWGPTGAGDGVGCYHHEVDVGGTRYDTYAEYLQGCAAPLARGDGVPGIDLTASSGVKSDSQLIFLTLSERIEESEIEPIPLALSFDDAGSTDRRTLLGPSYDVVGFGDDAPGTNGIRRVALGATALSFYDSDARQHDVRLADGTNLFTNILMRGDGPPGASHVDWGAPLLHVVDGRPRVIAVNADGHDSEYVVPLSARTRPLLEEFLDPDGDGVHRGYVDAVRCASSDGTDRPCRPGETGTRLREYVDRDADGLSEYRITTRSEGGDDCIEAPLAVAAELGLSAGSCLLPTGNDNCPPPLTGRWFYDYSNRNQRDRDGDGRGDVCDTCPIVWQASHDLEDASLFCRASRDIDPESPTGRAMGRGLLVGDPVSITCVTGELDRPSTAEFDETNRDGDEMLDLCDNCPPPPDANRGVAEAFANDQADEDGDGIGDACDSCPSAGNGRPSTFCATDEDCDGGNGCDTARGVCRCRRDRQCDEGSGCFADGYCYSDLDDDDVPDACDNCAPLERCPDELATCANAPQDDLDEDGVGDVCDNCLEHPNLAQQNCNLEAELELGVEAPLGDVCDPVPCAETFLTTRRRTDALGVTTETMDRITYDARIGTEDPNVEPRDRTVLSGRTTFRYCRCLLARADHPGSRTACEAPIDGLPGQGGCTLLDIDEHDELEEDLPWRWTTQAPFGTRSEIPDTYAYPVTGLFSADRQTTWALRGVDIPRWLREAIVEDPVTGGSAEIFPPGSAVPGVLWTHTPGAVGQPDFDELPEYGRGFRQLASHYWSGSVEPSITTREPFPCFFPFAPLLGGSGICPFCRGHVPQPWLIFGPASGGCNTPDRLFPFIQLGESVIEPGPPVPFEGLEHFVGAPGPWVSAAETGRWLYEQDGVRYATLAEGSRVDRVIAEQGGRFVDLSGNCPQVPCEPIPEPFMATTAHAADQLHAPLAREGHAAVLSARRRALWVIGGRASTGGAELRDVWRHDLDTDRWRALPLIGVELGRTLAATYSPVEDRLYVLDEVLEERRPRWSRGGRRAVRVIRLVALHPDGAIADVVARWRARSSNTDFELTVDPAGGIWIAGWHPRLFGHAVVRLTRRPDGALGIDGWDLGLGRVVDGGFRADDGGVTVVTEVPSWRRPRVRQRVIHHAADSLRRGRGGGRRCF